MFEKSFLNFNSGYFFKSLPLQSCAGKQCIWNWHNGQKFSAKRKILGEYHWHWDGPPAPLHTVLPVCVCVCVCEGGNANKVGALINKCWALQHPDKTGRLVRLFANCLTSSCSVFLNLEGKKSTHCWIWRILDGKLSDGYIFWKNCQRYFFIRIQPASAYSGNHCTRKNNENYLSPRLLNKIFRHFFKK